MSLQACALSRARTAVGAHVPLRNVALTTQDRLPGPRVCESHILECPDAPDLVPSRQNGLDQRIHLMRSGRMRGAGRQATPEMDDRGSVGNVSDIDQLIFQRGVAIDCSVNGRVERHDLIDALDIVPEAIHERRVFLEQAAKSSHVVGVPGGLECTGRIFRSFHFSHGVVVTSSLNDYGTCALKAACLFWCR